MLSQGDGRNRNGRALMRVQNLVVMAAALAHVLGVNDAVDRNIDDDFVVIDCGVGRWSAWSACAHRTQMRHRIMVVPPRGGGVECPALTVQRPCTQLTHTTSSSGNRAEQGVVGRWSVTQSAQLLRPIAPSWARTRNGDLPASCHMTGDC